MSAMIEDHPDIILPLMLSTFLEDMTTYLALHVLPDDDQQFWEDRRDQLLAGSSASD